MSAGDGDLVLYSRDIALNIRCAARIYTSGDNIPSEEMRTRRLANLIASSQCSSWAVFLSAGLAEKASLS